MRKTFRILLLLACGLAGPTAWAQVALPVYDAVVIKPNKSDNGSMSMGGANDAWKGTNVSMKQLLVSAYGIRDGLISGLPGWAESARFDVNAKVTDYDPAVLKKLTGEQRRAMLAAMLEDRFHVKTHVEVKELPVYELVVAKDGPKLPAAAAAAGAKAGLAGGGTRISSSVNGGTEMTAMGVSVAGLVGSLSNLVGRTVIDKTGLTGMYDIHLKWTAENSAQPPQDDAPPLIFTAIQEQLGLKLVSAKGPVKTLAVDRAEMPTEN